MRIILIGPDEELNRELTAVLLEMPDVELARTIATYPSLEVLLRTIHARKPDLLLVSVDDWASFETLVAPLENAAPGLPVVALGRSESVPVLTKMMHLGVREYLVSPFTLERVVQVVKLVQGQLKARPSRLARLADLYTFIPARPGVGASTLAVAVSCALADELGVNTLLMDGDLDAGVIKFLLKLDNNTSIVDALEHANDIDEDFWPRFVGRWEQLDVLHTGGADCYPNLNLGGLAKILSVARAQYEVICADLASSLSPFSMELMQESRRIFLVTTPEVMAIHFASRRMRHLIEAGLGDRVTLLLNRKVRQKGQLDTDEVARLVGTPVAYCFPDNYAAVQKAILDGMAVADDSLLRESVLNLAKSLTVGDRAKQPPPPQRHKYLEFFHLPRTTETEDAWKG